MNIIFDEKKEKFIAEFSISDLFYNPSLSSLSLAAMTAFIYAFRLMPLLAACAVIWSF